MIGYHGGGYHYDESEREKRARELGEGLGEQELSRLKNPTPRRVFSIVVASALLLLLIVGILGANAFHFW